MEDLPPIENPPGVAFSLDGLAPSTNGFYDQGEIDSNLTGVESQMLPAPISDSEEFVPETKFTCVDFSEMEDIVPETELCGVDFSDSATFLSESKFDNLQMMGRSCCLPYQIRDPPFKVNVYASEEARIQYLRIIGMVFPSVLKLI
ncbi:hypothetical protein OROGR_010378 [Orobanche gracilis]